jgi:hypothetical protein
MLFRLMALSPFFGQLRGFLKVDRKPASQALASTALKQYVTILSILKAESYFRLKPEKMASPESRERGLKGVSYGILSCRTPTSTSTAAFASRNKGLLCPLPPLSSSS